MLFSGTVIATGTGLTLAAFLRLAASDSADNTYSNSLMWLLILEAVGAALDV